MQQNQQHPQQQQQQGAWPLQASQQPQRPPGPVMMMRPALMMQPGMGPQGAVMMPQAAAQQGAQGGSQGGMQYMQMILPADQAMKMVPNGVVPLGQISAAQAQGMMLNPWGASGGKGGASQGGAWGNQGNQSSHGYQGGGKGKGGWNHGGKGEAAPDDSDDKLDDWLSKRMGKSSDKDKKGPSGSTAAAPDSSSQQQAMPKQQFQSGQKQQARQQQQQAQQAQQQFMQQQWMQQQQMQQMQWQQQQQQRQQQQQQQLQQQKHQEKQHQQEQHQQEEPQQQSWQQRWPVAQPMAWPTADWQASQGNYQAYHQDGGMQMGAGTYWGGGGGSGGDSPRTAAWRQALAQSSGAKADVDEWVAAREKALASGPAHRAPSGAAVAAAQPEDDEPSEEPEIPMEAFAHIFADDRPWADITEEDKTEQDLQNIIEEVEGERQMQQAAATGGESLTQAAGKVGDQALAKPVSVPPEPSASTAADAVVGPGMPEDGVVDVATAAATTASAVTTDSTAALTGSSAPEPAPAAPANAKRSYAAAASAKPVSDPKPVSSPRPAQQTVAARSAADAGPQVSPEPPQAAPAPAEPEPVAKAPAASAPAAPAPAAAAAAPEKRRKALQKKLNQIAVLEEKQAKGETLDAEQAAKVASKAAIEEELEQL